LVGADGSPDDGRPNFRLQKSLLDINGLAARSGVSTRFVRRLVAQRRVPCLKIGRLVRFDPVEVERWIDAARVVPARPRVSRAR